MLSSAGLQLEPTAPLAGHTAGDFTLSSQLEQQEAAADVLRAGVDPRTGRGDDISRGGYKGGAHWPLNFRGGAPTWHQKGGGVGKGKGEGPPLSNRKKKAAEWFRKFGRGGRGGGK